MKKHCEDARYTQDIFRTFFLECKYRNSLCNKLLCNDKRSQKHPHLNSIKTYLKSDF